MQTKGPCNKSKYRIDELHFGCQVVNTQFFRPQVFDKSWYRETGLINGQDYHDIFALSGFKWTLESPNNIVQVVFVFLSYIPHGLKRFSATLKYL